MSDWPGYLGYRLFSGLFGALPEPAARRIGEALGWAASWMTPRRMRLARRHMRRVLGADASDEEVRRKARRMFVLYGRYWAEVFWVRPRRKAEIQRHADVAGTEHIEAAKAAGRGLIVALPHLGNWEAAGAKAEEIGVPVLAVAEALKNEKIVDWFVEVRNALGIDVIIARSGRTTAALVRRLREGKTVALLADRDLKGTGIEVDFFGEKTTIPPGPVALAERTGAALLPVGCYFKPRRGHAFVVRAPIEIPEADTREKRVRLGSQRFVEVLEDIIRQAPEQWHLLVPNWPSDREEA